METFAEFNESVIAPQFVAFRNEIKGDINSLRTELKGDINSLRTELKGDIDSAKGDLARLESKMDDGFYNLRRDVRVLEEKIDELRRDVDALLKRVDEEGSAYGRDIIILQKRTTVIERELGLVKRRLAVA